MFIRSHRLFLRPAWPEDWQEILSLIGDEAIVRNLMTAPWPYTAEHAKDFVARQQERGLPQLFVTLPGSHGARLIGGAGLSRRGEEVELGYWIARSHWGQGYATEAARALVGLARALGHRTITAHHFADNPASGRVLEKAGFIPTGTVQMRFSAARGGEAPAKGYALSLRCSGGDCDDAEPFPREQVAA